MPSGMISLHGFGAGSFHKSSGWQRYQARSCDLAWYQLIMEDVWRCKKVRNIDVQIHSVAVKLKLLKELRLAWAEILPLYAVAAKKCKRFNGLRSKAGQAMVQD